MTARQSLTAVELLPFRFGVGRWELPVLVKQGVVKLAGHDIKIYELSDGRKVLDADDLIEIFEPPQL